jgi:integrase/recombinase XerD
MLSKLFPKVHRRYQQSPFATDLEDFSIWLIETGYSRKSTCGHLFRLRSTLEHHNDMVPGASMSEEQLESAFTSSRFPALYRATQRAFAQFLKSTARLIPKAPNDRFTLLLDDYREHLDALRGFAQPTIQQHLSTVRDFLGCVIPEAESLNELTSSAIERYVQRRSQEVTRQTMQHIVAHLRAFLRYCYLQDITPLSFQAIDTPRTYRDELPPRALDWKLVRALLASIDRTSPGGWRDYAILHLMAYYGLRPSEVADLELASIDWEAKTLTVEQRKTRSTLILPLSDRTIRLLRRYLREGRPPKPHPALFLRIRSPVSRLQHYGIVDIYQKRARLSGLPLQGTSSYALRHAFAMRLLHRGVGVKAIGDLLGHHSLESTCVYLRLDIETLRHVALPVPRTSHGEGGQDD